MVLHDEDVAAWLQALTDKQFVEFFYKHLSARQTDRGSQYASGDYQRALEASGITPSMTLCQDGVRPKTFALRRGA